MSMRSIFMPAHEHSGIQMRFEADSRTYIFEIRKSAIGRDYLRITEERIKSGKPILRQRIIVFDEHIASFLDAMNEALLEAGMNVLQDTKRVREIRNSYPKAYEKWSVEDDTNLREAYSKCKDIRTLADTFQRQPGAIESRLRKLALQSESENPSHRSLGSQHVRS